MFRTTLLVALCCTVPLAVQNRSRHPRRHPPAATLRRASRCCFAAGTNGYASFRIPAVIAGAKGTLLAFAEGRKKGTSDTGDIDVVLRRSTDGGRTWGPLQVIVDDGTDTVGNPCPVLDRTTGRVWLPLTRNAGTNTVAKNKSASGPGSREVLMCFSDDDGRDVVEAGEHQRRGQAGGLDVVRHRPGVGIQLKDGRLVIPCDHRVKGEDDSYSHVIY